MLGQSGKKLTVESKEPKNMNVVTLSNEDGLVVANLCVLKNGNLHPDSWLCHEGWDNENQT